MYLALALNYILFLSIFIQYINNLYNSQEEIIKEISCKTVYSERNVHLSTN